MRKVTSIALLCLLAACGSEESTFVKIAPRNPSRIDEVSKPTTLTTADQSLLLFDEVAKLHRSLRHIANRKNPGDINPLPYSEGCITYNESEHVEFLTAEYNCTKTMKPAIDGAPAVQYVFSGVERFKQVSEREIIATASLTLTVKAMTSPPKPIAQYRYERFLDVTLPVRSLNARAESLIEPGIEPGIDLQDSSDSDSEFAYESQSFPFISEHSFEAIGEKNKKARERWELKSRGKFRRLDSTRFDMDLGLRLTMKYWKPGIEKNSDTKPTHLYDVSATEAVRFFPAVNGCARVRDGAFNWQLADSSGTPLSGRWSANEDGLRDITTNSTTRWMTQCAEE